MATQNSNVLSVLSRSFSELLIFSFLLLITKSII